MGQIGHNYGRAPARLPIWRIRSGSSGCCHLWLRSSKSARDLDLGWGKLAQQANPQSPSAASQSAMCFDQSTSKVLLYGHTASDVGGVSSTTWLWDGAVWSRPNLMHNPGPRFDHLLVCGPQTILFGGLTNQLASPGTGTWLWSGADWQQATTTRAPEDCCGALVYDGTRYTMFEIGRDDIPTWFWTGSDWIKAS